jgi:hypothetical protein
VRFLRTYFSGGPDRPLATPMSAYIQRAIDAPWRATGGQVGDRNIVDSTGLTALDDSV